MASALSKSNGCANGLIGAQLLRGTGKLESLVINDDSQADGVLRFSFLKTSTPYQPAAANHTAAG